MLRDGVSTERGESFEDAVSLAYPASEPQNLFNEC